MAYFTEQARTPTECYQKIRTKYGDRAKVLQQRTVLKGGLFGIGGHEEVEMTGTCGQEIFAPQPEIRPRPQVQPRSFDLEQIKQEILAAAGKTSAAQGKGDPALQALVKEVQGLSKKLEDRIIEPAERADHPALKKLEEDMGLNDFSPSFTKKILDRTRGEFSLDELGDYEKVQARAAEWIGECITLYQEPEIPDAKTTGRKRPRIIVLVGPTGVGKTTTIAKMAALYGERSGGCWQKSVRLVTLDNYRIGGKYQIEKYGEIMEIPVSAVENYESLRSVLALYRKEVDFILVDTIGKSPRNFGELGEMRAILEACGAKAEIHLCISASTKAGDIEEIFKHFEPFNYGAVIITKLDETSRVGNVISALSESAKPVSFITDGQTVPSDIAKADVIRFLMYLEGFVINRDALTRRFAGEKPERS